MSSNLVFHTHQDNHLNLRDDQSTVKTSEQVKSFKGSFKLTKQASKSKRKTSETLLTNLKAKMVVGYPCVITD